MGLTVVARDICLFSSSSRWCETSVFFLLLPDLAEQHVRLLQLDMCGRECQGSGADSICSRNTSSQTYDTE